MGYFLDAAQMTVAGTPGTGAITLSSAIAGYQTFSAAGVANGQLIDYSIADAAGAFEYGRGTYSTTGPTLTRTTVLGGSSGASPISATSAAVVTATVSAESLNALGVGFRNRIINGDMRIDQRNSGASQTIVAAAGKAYTVDRFYAYCTGANVAGQRVAGSAPDQSLYQFTGAASVTAIGFGQRIETANSFDLAGQSATLSVKLANSLLTTVTWAAYYATTADTFGPLSSPSKTLIATGAFTVNSTLATYSAQIAIPGAATTGIEIVLSVAAQTSGTWEIGEVQLEPGQVATPFERRPIGLELLLCQRYCQTYNASAVSYAYFGPATIASTTVAYAQFVFPQMRVAPTVGLSSAANYQIGTSAGYVASAISASNQTLISIQINLTISGATANQGAIFQSASNGLGYINLSAEL